MEMVRKRQRMRCPEELSDTCLGLFLPARGRADLPPEPSSPATSPQPPHGPPGASLGGGDVGDLTRTTPLTAANGRRCSGRARDRWDAGSHGRRERLQPKSRASLPRPLLLRKALQPSAWWGETKTNDSLLLNCSRDRRDRTGSRRRWRLAKPHLPPKARR